MGPPVSVHPALAVLIARFPLVVEISSKVLRGHSCSPVGTLGTCRAAPVRVAGVGQVAIVSITSWDISRLRLTRVNGSLPDIVCLSERI